MTTRELDMIGAQVFAGVGRVRPRSCADLLLLVDEHRHVEFNGLPMRGFRA